MRLLAPPLALLLASFGCAELLQTEPGSPGGGPYCNAPKYETKRCYPSEAQRAAAWKAREDEEHREWARVHPDEAQAEKDAATARANANAPESPQHRWLREQDEAKAAQAAERDRVFAERRAAEDARRAADAAHAAKLHEMASDPAYAVPAISAIMCSIQDELTGLRGDLAHEKRVTAVGGVVNLSARDEAANDIVNDTDELAGWKAALKRFGAAQLPCKDMAPIIACRPRPEACDEAIRGAAEVWAREQATLWGSERERPTR